MSLLLSSEKAFSETWIRSGGSGERLFCPEKRQGWAKEASGGVEVAQTVGWLGRGWKGQLVTNLEDVQMYTKKSRSRSLKVSWQDTSRLCLHCGRAPGWAGRGLCNQCYNNRGIRGDYARLDEKSVLSVEETNMERLPPLLPTKALPGSDEKIRILRIRWRDGEALWHPDDEGMPKSAKIDLPNWSTGIAGSSS